MPALYILIILWISNKVGVDGVGGGGGGTTQDVGWSVLIWWGRGGGDVPRSSTEGELYPTTEFTTAIYLWLTKHNVNFGLEGGPVGPAGYIFVFLSWS